MAIIGKVKSQGLNVRARPALHAKRLDALARGDEVEILDRAAPYGYAWLKVKARKQRVESGGENGVESGAQSGVQRGVIGWVYAADVDIAPPPPDAARPAPAPQPAPAPDSPAPQAPELNAPAQPRAPRRFVLAALALVAGLALLAWLLG
jgi:SH3 domain-containing protein